MATFWAETSAGARGENSNVDLNKIYGDAKRLRDELALKVNLERSAKDVQAAAEILGSELKTAYKGIRQAPQ